jgi:hypothetical protein
MDHENVETITRSTMATVRRHLPPLAILKDLLESFRKHGLQAIPIKGPALGEFLYGEPFMRQFADLDILIRPNDTPKARRIVMDRGFEPLYFQPRPAQTGQGPLSLRHEHYMIPGSATHLELHWEIAHRGFAESFNAGLFWRNLGQRRYEGVDILWPSREILLLYGAIHGTRHGWTRLMWICDVAWLANGLSHEETLAALELAKSLSCQNLLIGALLIAHSVFGGFSPAVTHYCREVDIRHKALRELVQRELFIEKGHDREKVNFFLCRLLSMDGPRDTALVLFHYIASQPSTFPILALGPLRAFPHFIVRLLRTMGSSIEKYFIVRRY